MRNKRSLRKMEARESEGRYKVEGVRHGQREEECERERDRKRASKTNICTAR